MYTGNGDYAKPNWEEVHRKFKKVLADWSGQSLSLWGKATILNTVAISKLTYVSTVIHLSAEFLHLILWCISFYGATSLKWCHIMCSWISVLKVDWKWFIMKKVEGFACYACQAAYFWIFCQVVFLCSMILDWDISRQVQSFMWCQLRAPCRSGLHACLLQGVFGGPSVAISSMTISQSWGCFM